METSKTKKTKVITIWQCVNPNCVVCKPSLLPYTSDDFVTSFYGIQIDEKKKRKVCSLCFTAAFSVQDILAKKIQNKKPVLDSSISFPIPNDILTIVDSDEESKTDSSEDSEIEIDLTEEETSTDLDSILQYSLHKYDFKKQMESTTEFLKSRLSAKENEFNETDKLFKDLETSVVELRTQLYANYTCTIKELPSLDVSTSFQPEPLDVQQVGQTASIVSSALPPIGDLERPPLKIGDKVYGMSAGMLNIWKEGVIMEMNDKFALQPMYKVRFEILPNTPYQYKLLIRNHVAYYTSSQVRIPIGTRIIGIYKDDSWISKGNFYTGIIAEPPKVMNRFRYLIFFDDGYASYISHDNIRIVSHQSFPDVWEDVHPRSREFIKQYLSEYPERPMVKLTVDQVVWTEWEGKWWSTKVVEVDSSLVKLSFKDNGRTEFVYRGSTRLSPLYKEMQQKKLRKEGLISHRRGVVPGKKNTPYVEYTRTFETDVETSSLSSTNTIKRAVAKKSTSASSVHNKRFNETTRDSKGEISKVIFENKVSSRKYEAHTECGVDCQLSENVYDEKKIMKLYSPLLIPIALGWDRQLVKHKNQGARIIFYIAPCGRRLRNMDELHRYLKNVGSSLEIDFFTFDWWVRVYNIFKPTKEFCKILDISYGKENVPVSCVNSLDKNYPEYVEYSTARIPQKDVNLNLDPDFLVSCDCEDDCRTKNKCACWSLTLQATAASAENRVNYHVGYNNRRLSEAVLTGIYECNSRCKCKQTCFNRVAQLPLRVKLQVFKTERRGWGIRTLHDIPQGGFVCVYVGNLYTNAIANTHGQNFGDEYFAELDMIEAVERTKEGYESDVEFDEKNEDEEEEESLDVISDFSSNEGEVEIGDKSSSEDRRSSLRKKTDEFIVVSENEILNSSVSSSDHVPKNFNASLNEGPSTKNKYVSARKLIGKDEDVYIMDAKTIGNIGRYLNHSCNPNIFVQNCFVDTHDLRYPWVAFFTSTYIRAGSELCWDYCYIVDQVEGKEIYCECGAENCRGRLL